MFRTNPNRLTCPRTQHHRPAYFDGALPMRWWREGVAAGQPPALGHLDRQRIELDEMWLQGASRKSEPRGAFPPEVVRVMRLPTKYVDGFMHFDELVSIVESRREFSANIHLTAPPTGRACRVVVGGSISLGNSPTTDMRRCCRN